MFAIYNRGVYMQKKATPNNNLQIRFPEIAKEWGNDNTKSPNQVAPYSHYKAWWICSNCGYKWQAFVNSRTKSGRGCPACSGQVVRSGINDLASRFPEIAKEWDYKMNNPITPDMVSFGAVKKYYWKCPVCNNSYLTSVNQRTNLKSGCPYCSNHKVMPGFNDFETKYPDISKEWDYEGNGDLLPNQILCNVHKQISWKCPQCGNKYFAYPQNRIRGDSCPYCSGHEVMSGYNDLATLRPDLLEEWDYDFNKDVPPNSLTIGSNRTVGWICSVCGHKWQAPVARRTYGGSCPKCNHRNHTSFPEQALFYYVKIVYDDAINGYTELFDNGMELDIFIPSQSIGIEYDGIQWHKKTHKERESKKYSICKEHGITLIRITEDSSISPFCDYQIISNYRRRDYKHLDSSIIQLFEYLKTEPPTIKTENDSTAINEQYLTTLRKGSFGSLFPQYCSEWNHEKNGSLTPFMFFPYSNESVWWKCGTCGKEYKMTIAAKAAGRKCKNCSYIEIGKKLGKKVVNLDTKQIFDSLSEAAAFYGHTSSNSLWKCCHGKQHTAYGFHWAFLEED